MTTFISTPDVRLKFGVPQGIACAVIAASVLCALIWVTRLPMFQGPDEDNHYDYALTLATAGRPIAPSEGDTRNDTHPTVRYLVERTGARRLRFDPSASVPAGYGTRDYYAALDRGAPPIDRARFTHPIHPVPFIAKLYPFGYYWCAAAAIALAGWWSGGSVVAAFFAVRLLSVVFLAVTLWFTYRAFAESAGQRRALVVLAATAFFPIYLSIFAGVQPDNLGSALIAALWLYGLRLIRNPASTRLSAACGVLLALLIATKWHFFAALALPLLGSFCVAAWLRSLPVVRALRQLVVLVVPAVAAFMLTTPFLASPPGSPALCGSPTAGLAQTVAGPAVAFQHFVVDGLLYSLRTSFSASNALWFFWLKFGQYGASIEIVNQTISVAIADIIQVFVAIALVLGILRVGQNAIRLAPLWFTRRRAMLRVITGDFIVNSYLVYFVILFAYIAYTGSSIVIRGRYWFAFLPVIWYFALFLAPRALPRRAAAPLTNVMAVSLFAFELAATAFTIPSIDKAYYAPRDRDPSSEIFARFEDWRGKWPDAVDFGTVSAGTPVTIRGVAFDKVDVAPATSIRVKLDGRPVGVHATRGEALACILTETQLYGNGFEGTVDTAALPPGKHRISLAVRTPWSGGWIESGASGSLRISPKG